MTPLLWIGFGFLLLLVIFLICSFFFQPRLTNDQRGTLKLLSALCAGFSGGFLAGGALFDMHQTTGTLTYGISGTAGFALFMIVWFFYPKVFKLDDGSALSIAEGWTFRDTVDRLTQNGGAVADYIGFTPAEYTAAMQSRSISEKSLKNAILQLRLLTVKVNAVRPYEVTQDGTTYRLKIQ